MSELSNGADKLIGLPFEKKEELSLNIIKNSKSYADVSYTSFSGGKKSLVLLDMVKRCSDRKLNVLYVDTGLQFESVLLYINKLKKLWGFNLLSVNVENTLARLSEGKERCCGLQIIETIKRSVKENDIDCLYVGSLSYPKEGVSSICFRDESILSEAVFPISHFTEEDIWTYIRQYNLPYCSLYDKNYRYVDCEPCSMPISRPEKDAKEEARIKESLRRLGYI